MFLWSWKKQVEIIAQDRSSTFCLRKTLLEEFGGRPTCVNDSSLKAYKNSTKTIGWRFIVAEKENLD